MKKKYYTPDGYVDFPAIRALGLPWNFLIGGRGIGKTFGALSDVLLNDIPFMFMRRTQAQADLINKPEFSPFKSINRTLHYDIVTKPLSKYNSGFYQVEGEEARLIGYTGALSTISNIRGFDASDVRVLIYDEFIPERHERPIKNEAAALFNAYETISRNRELYGESPLQVFCLANANDPANAIFMELGLVNRVVSMMNRGQDVSIDRERGFGIFLFHDSPISEGKKNNALYKLTAGSDFERMALGNEFTQVDNKRVKSRPLREYKPVVTVGELTIYTHKSTGRLYGSLHQSGSPQTFASTESDLAAFRRAYLWIWDAYLEGNMDFESYLAENLLTTAYK